MPQMFEVVVALISGLIVLMFFMIVATIWSPLMLEITPGIEGVSTGSTAISLLNLWPIPVAVATMAFLLRSMLPRQPQFGFQQQRRF